MRAPGALVALLSRGGRRFLDPRLLQLRLEINLLIRLLLHLVVHVLH